MEVKITFSASKQLEMLDESIRNRILSKLLQFNDPSIVIYRKKLKARVGERRIRIGDYRVIITETEDCITVNEIGHRREIYRD